MAFIINIFLEAWHLLLESSLYVIFGLLVSGLLQVFLNPNTISRQLGQGKFKPVFKAAFMGIPLPLCSCGVLPAAVSLRKQGANTGATTAFLISTPESGIDSLAITYALLDPVMTVARPVAAFTTATVAGIAENTFNSPENERSATPDLTCPVDACCDGKDCPPEGHKKHHTLKQKVIAGFKYALTNVWGDMAGWFLLGLLLAGLITTLVSEEILVRYLGGGLPSMLLMLAVGIPLYICATASTPVAAALILKGVSPGAALVFLLGYPQTAQHQPEVVHRGALRPNTSFLLKRRRIYGKHACFDCQRCSGSHPLPESAHSTSSYDTHTVPKSFVIDACS